MTDPNAPSPANPNEPLQFDRVEGAAPDASAMQCASCKKPIHASYYDVDGQHVCLVCKDLAERANEPARGFAPFLKALVLGFIACLIGAGIYYGIAAAFNLEIGLVAILIGFMVGYAVRMGTGGRGGRRYQVLALLLTYFSVGIAYTPFAVKGMLKGATSDTTTVADSVDADSVDAARALQPVSAGEITQAGDSLTALRARLDSLESKLAESKPAEQLTPGGFFAVLGLVFGGGILMALALPIFAVLSDMPGGLISALIIGIGMHQAWQMTRAQNHVITGPYRVGEQPPGSPPPATA